MLSKEEKDIISKIGRHKFKKMVDLGLTIEQFQELEETKKKEKALRAKIGYREFNRMKKMNMHDYEEYTKYVEGEKANKLDKKKIKDKIRFRTIRFIERYCNLEKKCQICNNTEDVQIHHPNYKDYLKINLLCRECHTSLHNFELVPPKVIDLEQIAVKAQPLKEKTFYINSQIENIKNDIYLEGYTLNKLYKKYKISSSTIKRYLMTDNEWLELKKKLTINAHKQYILSNIKVSDNPIQKYRLEHQISVREFSEISEISMPAIRKIESGATDISKIKPKTRMKLEKVINDFGKGE